MPDITLQAVKDALKKPKKHKASDTSGLIAEMLKTNCGALLREIAELFNMILKEWEFCSQQSAIIFSRFLVAIVHKLFGTFFSVMD